MGYKVDPLLSEILDSIPYAILADEVIISPKNMAYIGDAIWKLLLCNWSRSDVVLSVHLYQKKHVPHQLISGEFQCAFARKLGYDIFLGTYDFAPPIDPNTNSRVLSERLEALLGAYYVCVGELPYNEWFKDVMALFKLREIRAFLNIPPSSTDA